MKRVLPWGIALALLAGLIAVYTGGKSKETELALLQRENLHLARLRAENEGLKGIQVEAAELDRLRKENEELHRLRNEVRQMREEKRQLVKPGQPAQPAAAPGKTEASSQQQLQQQLQQLLAENERLRAENQQFQQVRVEAEANACANNLRIIDAAKAQWALENKKPAGAPVSAQDIQPYLRNNALPACPQGGAYTLNALGTPPTCSIAGHVLAQQ